MLGPEGCDDTAYAALAKRIAERGELPETFGDHDAKLLPMIAKGLGLPPGFGLRQSSGAFIFRSTRLPSTAEPLRRFWVHSVLHLTCNHAGYARLWREQLGEAGTAFTWPMLSDDDLSAGRGAAQAGTRWAVGAAIEAVVAHAYGPTRDQCAHILSTFSHSRCRRSERAAANGEQQDHRLPFSAHCSPTQRHDPYWDIPLNENPPQPVFDLPMEAKAEGRRLKAKFSEKSQMKVFIGQFLTAPPHSGAKFAEWSVMTTKKTRKKNLIRLLNRAMLSNVSDRSKPNDEREP